MNSPASDSGKDGEGALGWSGNVSPEEVAAWHRDTPLLAAGRTGSAGRVHLNNAGASPQPQQVIAAVKRHLDLEQTLGGYEAADHAAQELDQARSLLGQCLGAPGRNVAFAESATSAYAAAVLSIDWKRDDVFLLSRYDYASNQILASSLARRFGVRVVRAEDLATGGVDPESVEREIEAHRPRLVSVTHMPTSSGLIQDVVSVGALCRRAGIPYLVDACQTLGQMPLEVEAIGCDFLAATGRKFLRGPRGTGCLYVSSRVLERGDHPLALDMRGADWTEPDGFSLRDDARRFEWWEGHVAGRVGLGAAARYALDVGLARIARRSAELARHVRERAADHHAVMPIDRGEHLGAIVSLAVRSADNGITGAQLVAALRDRRINTSITDRASALLDLGQRSGGREFALRVSPHYFNTEQDIDDLFIALEEIL